MDILTVRDVLEFLKAEVEKNPEILDYQVSRYDYDDFAVGFTGFTFPCHTIEFIDLPVEDGLDGVSEGLTTKQLLQIS